MPEGADDEIVTFRVARADRTAIERLVRSGFFRNRSEFLRHAIRLGLKEQDATPKLDLTLEGVELPTHQNTPARGAGRTRRGQAR